MGATHVNTWRVYTGLAQITLILVKSELAPSGGEFLLPRGAYR